MTPRFCIQWYSLFFAEFCCIRNTASFPVTSSVPSDTIKTWARQTEKRRNFTDHKKVWKQTVSTRSLEYLLLLKQKEIYWELKDNKRIKFQNRKFRYHCKVFVLRNVSFVRKKIQCVLSVVPIILMNFSVSMQRWKTSD